MLDTVLWEVAIEELLWRTILFTILMRTEPTARLISIDQMMSVQAKSPFCSRDCFQSYAAENYISRCLLAMEVVDCSPQTGDGVTAIGASTASLSQTLLSTISVSIRTLRRARCP